MIHDFIVDDTERLAYDLIDIFTADNTHLYFPFIAIALMVYYHFLKDLSSISFGKGKKLPLPNVCSEWYTMGRKEFTT